ncbi:MAG: endonuclease domain-containing protein, partial [Gaiellaceae bacterium]
LKGIQLGTKFRRQYSVDAYVLDFYAPQAKLATEIDGDSHFNADAIEYDQQRTAYLESFGIEVLRFTNLEVFENLAGVLTRIEDVLRARRATSP